MEWLGFVVRMGGEIHKEATGRKTRRRQKKKEDLD
jgi:hypothetical protein